jgi:competence protein ComEC
MPSVKKLKLTSIIFSMFLLLYTACSKELPSKSSFNRNPAYSEKDLLVHYIDVGQGDSILIQINNKNMLIDSGPEASSEKLIKYLKAQNVKKIDFMIATHPHEDHIGNLDEVLKNFKVAEVYAPKKTTNSEAFENFINSLKKEKLKINIAKSDISLDLGDNIYLNMLGPVNTYYEDINNYSSVIKITHGGVKFLFMGDAEILAENEIMNKNYDLTADVIKIGHHGSNSASSKEFLQKVSPKYAVISCGKGNDYGHPHKEVIEYLTSKEITTYRTDIHHDILLKSDGTSISKIR